MNPLEIVNLTPKTNCGRCGYPACLAFAANVAKSGEDPGKCPYIDRKSLALKTTGNVELDQLGEKRDYEFIGLLKEQVNRLDFNAIAEQLGACTLEAEGNTLSFSYLGQEVLLNREGIRINGRDPDDPRDQILLYNYIRSEGGAPPGREDWIGLENLPNSISKIKTLAVYCEDKLARHFTGRPQEEIIRWAAAAGGEPRSTESADISLTVQVLPRVPQRILFWEEDPDEGFPAKVKILYSAGVMAYLDLESLVFSSERLADRIISFFG